MALISNNGAGAQHPKSWRKWVEPWYLTYALQGAVVAGLLPILLPLAASRGGNAASIGIVMAALSLGGLSAPLWGTLTDRYRLHRLLLVGGLIIMAVGLIVFSYATQLAIWVGMAVVLGFGAAGSAIVANLFVVEAHPKAEWDERIGWLQTFYGVGQVGGLLLAGLLSQIDLRISLSVAAGLSGAAALLGYLTTKTPPNPLAGKPVLRYPAQQGEWATSSPQRLFHHIDLTAIKKLGPFLRSPFGLFLIIWLLAIGGSAAFFSQYPVLMQKVYGIPSHISSLAFAVVAGIGLALYSPAGNWSDHYGAARVLRSSIGVRGLAYIGLFSLGLIKLGPYNWLALLAFGFVVCAWSLISVSGTALAAQLSEVGEGQGLGIYNATNALAGVAGAALGGWAAQLWGYNFIVALAVGGAALGVILSIMLPAVRAKKKHQT